MSRNPPHVYTPSCQVIGATHADGLANILKEHVNLALWLRPLSPAIAHEVASLEPAAFPDVRCPISPDSLEDDVAALFRGQGLDPRGSPHWVQDIRELATLFQSLAGARPVTLRLETTDGDGCRRFHVDRTRLRLLCTYRGPGTEWLRNEQVDRHALAHFKPNEDILRHGAPGRFEPFWVGVMKGELFPGNAGNALVHRSPPVAGTDRTRVLMCLDC